MNVLRLHYIKKLGWNSRVTRALNALVFSMVLGIVSFSSTFCCDLVRAILREYDPLTSRSKVIPNLPAEYFIGTPRKIEGPTKGVVNRGIYEIPTVTGYAFIKFVPEDFFLKGLAFQHALASVGVSPWVKGSLTLDDAKKIGIDVYKAAGGIVMELLSEPWIVKYQSGTDSGAPKFVSDLNLESVLSQIDRIQEIFFSSGLTGSDIQILITKDSKVWVIDFDGVYIKPLEKEWNSSEFDNLKFWVRETIESNHSAPF